MTKLKRTPTPFDIEEYQSTKQSLDQDAESPGIETTVPDGPPITLNNRFDALKFADQLTLIPLHSQDQECGELVQPVLHIHKDMEVPSLTVQYTSMNQTLNGDETNELEYHVDYISAADIENLVKGFVKMEEEWTIPSDRKETCMDEMKEDIEYSLQQSNCIPLMSKVHQQPLVYQIWPGRTQKLYSG